MKEKHSYFQKIYDEYAKAIFRFVYLRVSDNKLAEDITSETFLKFWKQIKKNNQIENEKALLYFIARGLIIDHYRSQKYKRETSLEKTDSDQLIHDDEMVEKLHVIERVNGVYKKLKTLKKEYQEIIMLRFVEELEIEEIAEVLGKKQNAIRVTLHRAITAMRKKL